MSGPPIELVLYHDVLCSWCYLADARLSVLREELGEAVTFTYKAFPLRPGEVAPTQRELKLLARHYRRVGREPEGRGLVPDLWVGRDPPASTLPPLVALEAARLQGDARRDALLRALREGAFQRGLNIARRDILIEIASRIGLGMDRFLAGLSAPATEQAVRAEHMEALGHGVRGVPALIIGGDWLISGARDLTEYRELIERYRQQQGPSVPDRVLH
jgi:predicted DsbA family dithiol-disulfide isomerase